MAAEVVDLKRAARKPRRSAGGTVTLAMDQADFLRMVELNIRLAFGGRAGCGRIWFEESIEGFEELQELIFSAVPGGVPPSLHEAVMRTVRATNEQLEQQTKERA